MRLHKIVTLELLEQFHACSAARQAFVAHYGDKRVPLDKIVAACICRGEPWWADWLLTSLLYKSVRYGSLRLANAYWAERSRDLDTDALALVVRRWAAYIVGKRPWPKRLAKLIEKPRVGPTKQEN